MSGDQLRVALMPSAYTPSIGGVEEATRKLASYLHSSGVAVEVWSTKRPGDGLPDEEEVDGIPLHRFVMPLPAANLSSLMSFLRAVTPAYSALRSHVARFAPDLLHVQCFSTNGAYATALSIRSGVPLIVTLQGETLMDDHDIYTHSFLLRWALRAGLRRATAVTGCSAFVLEDAAQRFALHEDKGQVIFNGVQPAETEPRTLSVPFTHFILGMGRMVHKKGFDLLLAAYAVIARQHPDVGLVLAGDGRERDRLRGMAKELGLADRVYLPGALDRAEVEWALGNADVFVMPSRVEPFGIVVLEAWRGECPVVASNLGGASEFVREGIDGRLVDPHNTTALAAAIQDLLENEPLRKQLSLAGIDRVRSFEWPRIGAQYRRVYDQAVSS